MYDYRNKPRMQVGPYKRNAQEEIFSNEIHLPKLISNILVVLILFQNPK